MRAWPLGNGSLMARMPREVAALMDALQRRGANCEGLAELDRSAWRRLLTFSDRAHLTLALAELPLPAAPKWVRNRLEQNLADNARRFVRIAATFEEASAALDSAGVPYLVFKGFTQAPDYVADPRLRMQSDLDFFCPRSFIPAAVGALESIGYTAASPAECRLADHAPSMTRNGNWQWRGNMYDPSMPLGIDLHFCFWNQAVSAVSMPAVEAFRDRRVLRHLGGISFPALHPVDHFGVLATHILRDVLRGDSVVRHVRELAAFLDCRAADASFWREWEDLHPHRLRDYEALACALAQMWFSCRLPQAVRLQIDGLPEPQRAWLAQCGGAPFEAMFRRTKDGRLLQLLLVESWQQRRTVLRRALLPPVLPGPHSTEVRVRNPRGLPGGASLVVNYLRYLGGRIAENGSAILRSAARGAGLQLTRLRSSRRLGAFSIPAE